MAPRLVAVDMDGTFLDPDGRVPAGFAELYPRLTAAGVVFTPASGRQLRTLADMFGELGPQMSYIAENGAVVVHHGEVTSTTAMPDGPVHAVIDAVADFNAAGGHAPLWLLVCRPEVAYLTDPEAAEDPEVVKYYHSVEVTADLHAAADAGDVVKLAVFTPEDAETVAAPALREPAGGMSVVVSGAHWIDVMSPEADKGRALRELAGYLGCPREETVAFGDYLNDYELLRAAGTAYAMANAHPRLKEIADHIAPSNAEHGVITVLEGYV